MNSRRPQLSPLFISQFEVDTSSPFERHLNRLEVEIGREDYSRLKRVELLSEVPTETAFSAMTDITDRILESTQNTYNRDLLQRLGVRIYLEPLAYEVYYRFAQRCLKFIPTWRNEALQLFFNIRPEVDSDWTDCRSALPGFECRFVADAAGGVLLLRKQQWSQEKPAVLITASHGPYDPHTLEVALYFLRTGKGEAAIVNLGFAGREPLADGCLEALAGWGVPLNPSNIDVIYPYVDGNGHPLCYKLEEGLPRYVELLEGGSPELVIDVHGCVGTSSTDQSVIVGLGGLPPFHRPEEFGSCTEEDRVLHLFPSAALRDGLKLLRELSPEIYVQLCSEPHCGYNFALLGGMQLIGFRLDPQRDVASLMAGEERSYLPKDDLRWLPGAGANALQRMALNRLNRNALSLHVELPTAVRRKMVVKLHALEFESSLDASGL